MSQVTYEAVTNRIIEALEHGVVPWKKPWSESGGIPCNAVSKRQYSGINLFLLSITPFSDHRWVTFRQARELGGYVRPGETSSLAVFWKRWEKSEDGDEEAPKRAIPVLKHFHLFNVSQCDDLQLPALVAQSQHTHSRIERAETVVKSMPDPPRIDEQCRAAWYRPSEDEVGMPPLSTFTSADHFYATLFHELVHSTGHERRLARKGIMEQIQFGSSSYGHEELVAELGSAFICAATGLDNSLVENAASYISHWLSVLKHNPKALVIAASQAKKAADHICGIHPEAGEPA